MNYQAGKFSRYQRVYIDCIKSVGLCFLILLLFAGYNHAYGQVNDGILQNNYSQEEGSIYESLTYDGAWCWFSDPRAIYYEGKHKRTYATWVNSFGDIVVGFYDHDTKNIHTHVVYDQLQADDHAAPSILINKKGQLLVFYSAHATQKPIYLSRSKQPEEIDEWNKTQSLDINDSARYAGYSDTYTYTNPRFLSSENKIYLYWRGSDFKSNFSVSADGGQTWTKSRIFILPDRKYRNRRPYVKVASNGKDRIDFTFTDGHPRKEPENSVYYMYYRDGAYHKADGSVIQSINDGPIKPRQADVVYDARKNGNSKAWVWDVSEDQNGNPVIAYVKFPDDKTHIYCYARWNGKSWDNYELVDSGQWFPQTPKGKTEPEPNYSGGIVLDHDDVNTVYLSRQMNGVFEIEKWTTSNGGKTWSKESLTEHSSKDNVRPFAVRNAQKGNPLQVLWMNNTKYVHYDNFLTSLKMSIKPDPVSDPLDAKSIKNVMHRVANWQLENPLPHNKLNWHYGAFYSGLWSLYQLTGEQRFANHIINVGQSHNWQLMNPIYHADHLTVGQAYVNIDGLDHNSELENNMKWAAGMYLQRDAKADVRFDGNPYRLEWWSWCDALFMAPPFFANMYQATGNKDYLDYMNKHWWLTSHYLYDSNDHLFYRDDRFFDARTKNGKKVFWSRGNGWVMGGLVHVLQKMPDDYIYRSQYIKQFKEMADEIVSIQGDDGLWRPSLLDPEEYDVGESSGSSFFCFALAWGVNNEILEGGKYKAAAINAWKGLINNVNAEGRLGYVQPVGGSPESVKKDQYEVYGAGAFLLAGRQIDKLLSASQPKAH